MINLLPELYKLQFSREYCWRVVITALIFLDLVIVVAVVLLFPSYLHSSIQIVNSAASQESQAANKRAVDLHSGLVAQTATLALTLKALTGGPATAPSFTGVMAAITANKTSAISITSISYTTASPVNNTPAVTVSLRGVAATRNDLAQFVAVLKAEKEISSVKVPISDYAADTAVPFTVTLIALQK